MKEVVILLHGLFLNALAMKSIERSLRKNGFIIENLTYSSRSKNIEGLAKDVFRKIEKYKDVPGLKVHFVTHSLGSIVLRCLLKKYNFATLGRVVMLGPPNQGSEIADKVSQWKLFRFIFGPALCELTTHQAKKNPFPLIPAQIGVIAANKTIDPIFSRFLPSPHDGKVSVESTKLPNMCDHIVMETTHILMLFNGNVKRQIVCFLKEGKFAHG